jgi:hypothetical protein
MLATQPGCVRRAALTQHPDADALEEACSAHGPLLLVLLVVLYFGFVLPVYVAYRLEQHLMQHLRQHGQQDEALGLERGQRQRPQRSTATTACALLRDVGLLLLLAVLCWHELVTVRPLLSAVMWPLDPARVIVRP